jgi:ATP-dependent RNA helicase DeaD
MCEDTPAPAGFASLGLSPPILQALTEVGYESPSPIQAQTIPHLLAGNDVLGQAQTGTGKTAAFALPILARLDMSQKKPQALVLAPTRELAHPGRRGLPALRHPPARLPRPADLRRPELRPAAQRAQPRRPRRRRHPRPHDRPHRARLPRPLAGPLPRPRRGRRDAAHGLPRRRRDDPPQDPADPPDRAVLGDPPGPIRRIAQTHLRDPVSVTIAAKTRTADNIHQRYWQVSGMHKLDALTRILEAEPFDAMIVFARTKQATDELAERLQARGFAAAAINGDIQQQQRERTIAQLKDGKIDILVATDVAARGLDVERISHVLNYDVPTTAESYVHRIGRTGRAGRSGKAILFIAPRERNLLRSSSTPPASRSSAWSCRPSARSTTTASARFKQQISDTLAAGELDLFQRVIEDFERELIAARLTVAHIHRIDDPVAAGRHRALAHVTQLPRLGAVGVALAPTRLLLRK